MVYWYFLWNSVNHILCLKYKCTDYCITTLQHSACFLALCKAEDEGTRLYCRCTESLECKQLDTSQFLNKYFENVLNEDSNFRSSCWNWCSWNIAQTHSRTQSWEHSLNTMGSATGGARGLGPPVFRENQWILKIYNRFLIILTLWSPSFKPVADSLLNTRTVLYFT